MTEPKGKKRLPLAVSLGVGFGVTLLHFMIQSATWATWDRVIRPGEVRSMPWLWPIVSFPAFPLYEWLSSGDRAMFRSFELVLISNSLVWGAAGMLGFVWLTRRRVESEPKP